MHPAKPICPVLTHCSLPSDQKAPAMLTLTPLRAADKVEWWPLWQGYLTFYKASIADDVSDLTFDRLTNGREPMGGFITRNAEGRAIGIVHWITHRSCWTASDYCYLQDLFVADDVRGGGVGRQLIEAVYTKARALDCSRVHWLTHESNTTAMKLYDVIADKSGFVQYRKML
jgi:GNAT superfamily N-acetyltransferase